MCIKQHRRAYLLKQCVFSLICTVWNEVTLLMFPSNAWFEKSTWKTLGNCDEIFSPFPKEKKLWSVRGSFLNQAANIYIKCNFPLMWLTTSRPMFYWLIKSAKAGKKRKLTEATFVTSKFPCLRRSLCKSKKWRP